VPISYHGRTYADGKKIGWKDGFTALYCIGRFGLLGRLTQGRRAAPTSTSTTNGSRDTRNGAPALAEEPKEGPKNDATASRQRL
jgi:hypothetical protein